MKALNRRSFLHGAGLGFGGVALSGLGWTRLLDVAGAMTNAPSALLRAMRAAVEAVARSPFVGVTSDTTDDAARALAKAWEDEALLAYREFITGALETVENGPRGGRFSELATGSRLDFLRAWLRQELPTTIRHPDGSVHLDRLNAEYKAQVEAQAAKLTTDGRASVIAAGDDDLRYPWEAPLDGSPRSGPRAVPSPRERAECAAADAVAAAAIAPVATTELRYGPAPEQTVSYPLTFVV